MKKNKTHSLSEYEANNYIYEQCKYGKIKELTEILEQWHYDNPPFLPIILSVSYGKLDIVELLVSYGADVNSHDGSPLVYAASHGHLDILEYLLSKNADINVDNDAALRTASHNGNLKIVKFLVDNGANIGSENFDAIISAANEGKLDVVKYFIIEKKYDISIILNNDIKNADIKKWAKQYFASETLAKKLNNELVNRDTNKKHKI